MARDSDRGGFIFLMIIAIIIVVGFLLVNVVPMILDLFAIASVVAIVIGGIGIFVGFTSGHHNEIFYMLFFGGLIVLIISLWAGSSLDGFITNNNLNEIF